MGHQGQDILESHIYCSKYLVLPSCIKYVFIFISFLFSVPVLLLLYNWFGGNGGHVGNGPTPCPNWEDLSGDSS